MPLTERAICTRIMMQGFRDACLEADTTVTGGQTVLNPWPMIGGVATSIVREGEFVPSDGAQVGDVVVLTKALGTQVAVNVHEWRTLLNERWTKCQSDAQLTVEQAEDMMHQAVCSMARLNRHASAIMVPHQAHAATDVTGFGILGHAQNLMDHQQEAVGMELQKLPLIRGTQAVNDNVLNFRLTVGYSAETSGGLLICMPAEQAPKYIAELQRLEPDSPQAWIVGRIVADPNRKAKIREDCQFLQV